MTTTTEAPAMTKAEAAELVRAAVRAAAEAGRPFTPTADLLLALYTAGVGMEQAEAAVRRLTDRRRAAAVLEEASEKQEEVRRLRVEWQKNVAEFNRRQAEHLAAIDRDRKELLGDGTDPGGALSVEFSRRAAEARRVLMETADPDIDARADRLSREAGAAQERVQTLRREEVALGLPEKHESAIAEAEYQRDRQGLDPQFRGGFDAKINHARQVLARMQSLREAREAAAEEVRRLEVLIKQTLLEKLDPGSAAVSF